MRRPTCSSSICLSPASAREGAIAGAFNVPRGLLEFWFDAASGKPQLTRPDLRYVLFCAAGWRSALAARTLQEMGMTSVCHLGGGFAAWKAAGAPTLPPSG
jgi:rhodanese-related sulfurtransferase